MDQNNFVLREKCPACGSTNCQEVYSTSYTEPPISTYLKEFYSPQGGIEFEYLENGYFILDECKTCDLVYQRYIPNDRLMNKLYEEWIEPEKVFNSVVMNHEVEYYIWLARQVEMIIKSFNVKPADLEFFDFGMGWGEWCRVASSYGCTVAGTELSQSRIDYARKFGIPNISWEDISNYQFDLINIEQVFEHLSNPLETLQYLKKSLKNHGVIRISVPNGGDIKKRLAIMDWQAKKGSNNSLNSVAPLEHINCFSVKSIIHMAQICGLEPVNIMSQISMKRKILDISVRAIIESFVHKFIESITGRYSGAITVFLKQKKKSNPGGNGH